jgi:NADH-quinone oxidoreductase subunit L
MFFAAGIGAYGAAMFHLFTHAFFKALLFLGAGSVIHGMHHEQDMRFMGGVRKAMPITWAMMLIGTLALIGFGLPLEQFKIGFAGFWSKDHIIESAYVASEGGRAYAQFAFVISLVAALLTSFYSWRLMFMTFEGRYRPNPDAHHDDHADASDPHAKDAHAHDSHGHGAKPHAVPAGSAPAHESPWVMVVPLALLAVGAVLAGALFKDQFVGAKAAEFWNGTLALQHDPLGAAAHGAAGEGGHHELPAYVVWGPFGVTLLGFLIALPIYFFSARAGAAIAKATGPLHAFLAHKWYFDELYDAVFVKGARALGDFFWKVGDRRIIDGLGPNGVAAVARFGARQMRRLQTGYLYHYSFLMLVAAVAFGAYALWTAGLLGIAR